MPLIASVAAGSPDGNGFDTATIDTTGANLIVICAAYASEPTIVDSNSNTYTPLTAHGGGTPSQRMYYCFNPTVGAGHFFSANGAGHNASLSVLAFSGALSTPFDQQNGATGTGVSSQATGSITPTQDNEYVIATVALEGSGVTATIDSSMTLGPAITASAAPHKGVAVGWKQQSTAGAINPTFSLSGSSNTAAAIASFKASAPVAPPHTLLDWPNPRLGPKPSPQRFSEELGRNQPLFFVPPPPLPAGKSILFPNPTLHPSTAAWRNGFITGWPTNLIVPLLPAPTTVIFKINGADVGLFVNKDSIEINTYLNEQPSTCSFKINAFQPSVGQIIQIGLGSTDSDRLIFAGTITSIKQVYDGAPVQGRNNIAWECDCIDFIFLLNRRRPIGSFTNISASTVIQSLVTNFSSGFDVSGIPNGLPNISISFNGSTTFSQCLTDICNLILYKWKVSYSRVVMVFNVIPGLSPAAIDLNNTVTQLEPMLTYTVDLNQIRNSIIGKGPFSNLLSDVSDSETILPISDASLFGDTGVSFEGPNLISYTGRQTSELGTQIGNGIGPSTAVILAASAGAGLSDGVYVYEYTFKTALGESLPSPLATVTVGLVSTPLTPTALTPLSSSSSKMGIGNAYRWVVTFTNASGETLASAPTLPVTTSTTSVSDPSSGPTISQGLAAGIDTLTPGGSYQWVYEYVTFDGRHTAPAPASASYIAATYDAGGGSVGTYGAYVTVPYSTNTDVTQIYIYRTKNGGSTFYFDGGLYSTGIIPNNTAGGTGVYLSHDPDRVLTTTVPASNNTLLYSDIGNISIPVSPSSSVTGRKLYRDINGNGVFKLSTTVTDNSTTSTTDITPDASLGVTVPVSNTAIQNQVSVAAVSAGPSGTLSRPIYRSVANGSQPKLVTTLADNTTLTFLDTVADGSLGANAPTGDTSGLSIPIQNGAAFYTTSAIIFPTNGAATNANTPSPVFTSASYSFVSADVGASIYIKSGTNWISGKYVIASVAGGAATLVGACATIASPTTATWGVDYSNIAVARYSFTDMVIDASNSAKFTSAAFPVGVNFIGNVIAISNSIGWVNQRVIVLSTSGTVATCDKVLGTVSSGGGTGNLGGSAVSTTVQAGASSMPVASAGTFYSTGGWVLFASNYIRYTGISVNTLTGIPTTGIGSITAAIDYGSTITAVQALTGCVGVVSAPAGTNIYLAIKLDDTASQALLASLEGGDGVHQYVFSDQSASSLVALTAEAQSVMDTFSQVQITVVEGSRDINTIAGSSLTVNLPFPFSIAVVLIIQSVKITHVGTEAGAYPLFEATAATSKYTLQDLIRQLGSLITQ